MTTDARFNNASAIFTIDGFRFENVGNTFEPCWFGADDDGDFAVIGTPGDWVVCDAHSAAHEDTATRHDDVEDAIGEAREMNAA